MFLHEHALRKAIRLLGSQARLARGLNVDRSRINHWLNRDQYIPFEYACAIERLTDGRVRAYELAPYAHQLMLGCENFMRKECISYEKI